MKINKASPIIKQRLNDIANKNNDTLKIIESNLGQLNDQQNYINNSCESHKNKLIYKIDEII